MRYWPEPKRPPCDPLSEDGDQPLRYGNRAAPGGTLGVALDEPAADLSYGTADPDPTGLEVDVFDAQPDEFTEPHPPVGEQHHYIALGAARVGEGRHLSRGEVGV